MDFLAADAARQQIMLQEQHCRGSSLPELLAQFPLLGIPVGIKDIFATVDMPPAVEAIAPPLSTKN